MAASLTGCSFFSTFSLSTPALKAHRPINSLLRPNFSKPTSPSRTNPTFSLPRLRVSQIKAVPPKPLSRLLAVSGSVDGNFETCPEVERCDPLLAVSRSANGSSEISPEAELTDSSAGKTIHIQLPLPRRRMLAAFTCNKCGVRSQRLINQLAYEQGLVYVQCEGCEVYHKLVDNKGLIVEVKFDEEASNTDQV